MKLMRFIVRKPTYVNNEKNTPAAMWPLHSAFVCETWGEAWIETGASPIGKNGVGVKEGGQLVYLERST